MEHDQEHVFENAAKPGHSVMRGEERHKHKDEGSRGPNKGGEGWRGVHDRDPEKQHRMRPW